MRALRVLGTLVFAGCSVTFAEPAKVVTPAPINVEQICGAASTDTAPPIVEVASAALPGGRDGLQPNPPVVNDGGGTCPTGHQCSCGAPQLDTEDPACYPGVDLGTTHCRSLHCPTGQTVHYRVCPCSTSGCNPPADWSALFCAVP